MRNIFLVFFLLSAFVACKKLETQPPMVSLSAPMEADTVHLADSLQLQCTITDSHLSRYKIIIYNYYSRKLFYQEEGNAGAGTFVTDKKIYFDINADTTAFINVLGIDKNGNTGKAGTKFYIRK